MGNVRDNLKQKAAARQKKRRAEAQKVRANKNKHERAVLQKTADDVADWPVSDCYLSDNWHEQGAKVHAVFTRMHQTGRIGAAFFELDFSGPGVVQAELRTDLVQPVLQSEIVRRAQERSMLVVEPDQVVKMVLLSHEHAAAVHRTQAAGFDDAVPIFGDLDGSTFDLEPLFGPAAEPEKKEEATGFFANLRRRIGLG